MIRKTTYTKVVHGKNDGFGEGRAGWKTNIHVKILEKTKNNSRELAEKHSGNQRVSKQNISSIKGGIKEICQYKLI